MLLKDGFYPATARAHKRMVRSPNPMHDCPCRKHARDNDHQTNTSLTARVIHDCPCYGIARARYRITCERYRSGADACASETEASYNACQYHILSTYRTLYTSTRPLAPAPTRSPHATRPSELRTPRGRHGIARTRCISRTDACAMAAAIAAATGVDRGEGDGDGSDDANGDGGGGGGDGGDDDGDGDGDCDGADGDSDDDGGSDGELAPAVEQARAQRGSRLRRDHSSKLMWGGDGEGDGDDSGKGGDCDGRGNERSNESGGEGGGGEGGGELLWQGSSANSGGPQWRRGARATRRSAVARATEKAAAETAAASVVARSAPARGAILSMRHSHVCGCAQTTGECSAESPPFAAPDFLLCLRTLPFFSRRAGVLFGVVVII